MTETSKERGQWTSASSAGPDAACPGRHLAQRGIVERQDTEEAEWAASGTKVHNALAKQSTDGLTASEVDLYDRCMECEAKLLEQWFGVPPDMMRTYGRREQRMWIGDANFKHSGQSDVWYAMGDKALVVDYKTLTGETPEASSNMQLRDLAVITWMNRLLLKNIAVAVIQPLVTMKPELCVYDEAQITRAALELQARVKASNDPKSLRVAGELQCKYCRAKNSCQQYQQWAGSKVPVPVGIVDTPIANWTPDQRALFCEHKGRAQKWLDDCEAEMKRLLKADPKAIPGWVLKDGDERERINNPQEAFDRCSKHGMSLQSFMGCVTVGKGKLKDALAEATKETTKLKGKKLTEAMDNITAGIVEVSQNQPSLTKE